MSKKNSVITQYALIAGLTLALSPASHAEIYKWVDAHGQTHYSENKDDAGKGKAEEMKIKSKAAPATNTSAQGWQEQEQEFKRRLVQKQLEQPQRSPAAMQARSGLDRNQTETDASRCNLARQINNGTAVHSNGAKTDTNDRMIAERDVSTYCH